MIVQNLDILLDLLTKLAWILFGVGTLLFFVRNLLRYGIKKAFILLFSGRMLTILLIPLIVTLISLSLVFVEPQRVGIVVSAVSPNGMRSQPLMPGLHWIIPILEQSVIYPTYWENYTMSNKPREGNVLGDDSIRARTSDGQEVLLSCSIIFRVDPSQVIRIHTDWQNRYIDEFVRPIVRGYVRTQVSQFTVKEVNSSARKDLEATLDSILANQFATKGLILDQFILRDIAFSEQYADSIEKKQVALEGQAEKEYEAEQIRNLTRGKADAIRIEAQGKADAIRLEAEAQAAALEMIGQVLDENEKLLNYSYIEKIAPNIKVMLLPNNNPLLLPLPSIDALEEITPTEAITTTPEILPDIDTGGANTGN